MNKERENIDILHMPSHACSHACMHTTPDAKLQYSQDSKPPSGVPVSCWHCSFFHPEGIVSRQQPLFDEAQPGECRIYPPQVGDLIHRGTDDEQRWYGNFPRVMAGDWCGQFQVNDAAAQ